MRRRSTFAAVGAACAVAAALAPAGAQANDAHCGAKPLKPTLAADYPAGCRVYEKVSPADKGNGEVQGGETLVAGVKASRDGETFVYGSDGTFAGATSFAQLNAYSAVRQPGGWLNAATTGQLPYAVIPLDLMNPDPAGMMLMPVASPPLTLSDDGRNLVTGTNIDQQTGEIVPGRYYRLDITTGQAAAITPFRTDGVQETVSPNASTEPRGTADYSTLAISLRAGLTADTANDGLAPGEDRLYLWRGGALRFVGRLPGSEAPSRSMLAHGANDHAVNDVSADGKAVFWTPHHFSTTQQKVFRYSFDADASVEVSASENAANPDPLVQPAIKMVGATPDGRDAFFTSQKQLVAGLPAPQPGDNPNYLYRYRHSVNPATDSNLTLISALSSAEPGKPRVVTDLTRMSRDGSTMYIHAQPPHRLTADAPANPSSRPGIYRWRDGEMKFVAYASVQGGTQPGINQVSDDGRFYTFDSSTQVTATPTGGTTQRYLYDDQTGRVSCASCRSDGATTVPVIGGTFFNFMSLGTGATSPRRYLANDGTVVVESTDRLLPQDRNDFRDTYVYRNGQHRLMSTGQAPTDDVRFSDMSADGAALFFVTREQLSAHDTDGKKDAYVARVDGGLPEPVIRPAARCVGDACQPRTVVPPPPPISSLSFVGPGNVDAGPEPLGDAEARKPKTIRGAKGSVSVRVPAEGRVRVSGNGLRRATRKASKARTLRVPVRLSKRATRTLDRKRRFSTRITVRYTPEQGKAQKMRVSVRFQKAKTKSSSRSKALTKKAKGR